MICADCTYRIERVSGEWIAEDDTACCAGRGDPNAEPAECLPHRPATYEAPRGTFHLIKYPQLPFNRDPEHYSDTPRKETA